MRNAAGSRLCRLCGEKRKGKDDWRATNRNRPAALTETERAELESHLTKWAAVPHALSACNDMADFMDWTPEELHAEILGAAGRSSSRNFDPAQGSFSTFAGLKSRGIHSNLVLLADARRVRTVSYLRALPRMATARRVEVMSLVADDGAPDPARRRGPDRAGGKRLPPRLARLTRGPAERRRDHAEVVRSGGRVGEPRGAGWTRCTRG